MDGLDASTVEQVETRLTQHSAHLRTLLNGAVASFSDPSNPARFVNTGNLLRELLRELFATIAPDTAITQCSWYTLDESSQTGITRRHRTLFAVYSYLNPDYFPHDFVSEVDKLATTIRKQVEILSSFAHPTAATLGTPQETATAAFDSTLELFLTLFRAIDSAREHLLDALQIDLQERLADLFTNDFFDELDSLSTHTRPQDADGIEVKIVDIDEGAIRFTGTGRVYCDLQFGSDGDCSRGDGIEWKDSFPFTYCGEAPTSDPRQVAVNPGDVSVDTSSYYG